MKFWIQLNKKKQKNVLFILLYNTLTKITHLEDIENKKKIKYRFALMNTSTLTLLK